MDCSGALSVILSADVRRFLRVGVKVALAMQLAFTERPAPPIGQLWVCAKFAVFPLAMVMPEMIRFDPLYLKRPLLYVMLVTVGSNPESPFWGKPNSNQQRYIWRQRRSLWHGKLRRRWELLLSGLRNRIPVDALGIWLDREYPLYLSQPKRRSIPSERPHF